ncbi:OmpA family protein [Georgfuchsia toluolica]|uniref:OmpA family protein n=1 Tax=Georgfuchsia toluolica TaxID=424218 RepID=UPI001C73CC63|nr:hypothetical protein [Georgfuchsia toluolica]
MRNKLIALKKARMLVCVGVTLMQVGCGTQSVRQADADSSPASPPTMPRATIRDLETRTKSSPVFIKPKTSVAVASSNIPLPDPASTIFFSLGSTVLGKDAYPVIDAAAKKLGDDRSTVLLVGHSGDLTSNEYCIGFSEKRIAVVEAELLKRGIRRMQIRRRPLGKGAFASSECRTKSCREASRSVELKLPE